MWSCYVLADEGLCGLAQVVRRCHAALSFTFPSFMMLLVRLNEQGDTDRQSLRVIKQHSNMDSPSPPPPPL